MLYNNKYFSPGDSYIKFPDHNEFALTIQTDPISSQASSAKKRKLTNDIQFISSMFSFHIKGDVSIDLEWYVHEQQRYETDSCPDTDNIIKPILDALTGTRGFLIDDCQVQSVSCRWIDIDSTVQSLRISIRSYSNHVTYKQDGVFFVQYDKCLCFPFWKTLNGNLLKTFAEHVHKQIAARNMMIDAGRSYYSAKGFMPIQRLFHKTRIKDFPVISYSDLVQANYFHPF